MPLPLFFALIGLCLVMCASRQVEGAVTPEQLWATVRPLGWRMAPITIWRGFRLLLLIAGCLGILTLNVTQHTLQGAAWTAVAIHWKVCDLADWHPVVVWEARS